MVYNRNKIHEKSTSRGKFNKHHLLGIQSYRIRNNYCDIQKRLNEI
uniref:Uncharacterized protein n=1 Tax=Rhizophora mucronata TaxID=61149 RepID=A0A2P2NRN5_RHIMU